MPNERLRAALLERGLTPSSLSDELGVDQKTVERWIARQLPYRKHRFAVAALLGVDEVYLWPGALSKDQVAATRTVKCSPFTRIAPTFHGRHGSGCSRRPNAISESSSTPACSWPRTRSCKRSSRTGLVPGPGYGSCLVTRKARKSLSAVRTRASRHGGREDPECAGVVPGAA